MNKWVKLLNNVILYGFFLMAVFLLFTESTKVLTILVCFISFILSIILAFLLKTRKVSEKYWIFLNIALLLNLLGEYFIYYSGQYFYDKLLHLYLGFLLSAIIYDYYKNDGSPKKEAVFFTVLGLLAAWEIFEYSLDFFFGFKTQGIITVQGIILQSPIDDTIYDLIWGVIGSLIHLFFKKEKLDIQIKKDLKIIANVKPKRINFKKIIKELFIFK